MCPCRQNTVSSEEDPADRVLSVPHPHPQAAAAHPGSSPLAGFPGPKPELISQLEQEEELWVLDLLGAEEPEVLRRCQTGEHVPGAQEWPPSPAYGGWQ